MSEYLQAAAAFLELPALKELTMKDAEQQLSAGVLSYLRESRRICNQKLLQHLGYQLKHPDFRQGIKHWKAIKCWIRFAIKRINQKKKEAD